MSVNKVIILGRVGKDVEMRYLPNSNAVASFSVATSEKWKDKTTGQSKEETTWHNIVAFAKLAEVVGQYVNKGDQIYIEGKIKNEQYEGKDGVMKYVTKVIADKVDFIGGQKSDGTSARDAAKSGIRPSAESVFDDFDIDDSIPF